MVLTNSITSLKFASPPILDDTSTMNAISQPPGKKDVPSDITRLWPLFTQGDKIKHSCGNNYSRVGFFSSVDANLAGNEFALTKCFAKFLNVKPQQCCLGMGNVFIQIDFYL